jgi:hypothetical protein
MKSQDKEFKPSFNNLAFASKAFEQLDLLCEERKAWEDLEEKNSTTRLYNLLARVYAVYKTKFVDAQDDDRRTLRLQLVGKLNAHGITVRKTTDTLGLLIRYVFKTDRRRVMSYKYAIFAANSHDVSPSDLPQWLSNAGGIDEVSRKISQNEESIKRREAVVKAANLVEELISKRTDAPLATLNLPIKTTSTRVLMLAEPCGNNEFKVLFVFDSPSDGVQKTLIRTTASKAAEVIAETEAASAEAKTFIRANRANKAAKLLAA